MSRQVPEWYIPAFDNHLMCSHCRSETGQCQLILSSPCEVCEVWPVENWYRLLRTASGSRRRGVSSSLLGNGYLLPLSFYNVGYVRGTFVGHSHLTWGVPKETPEP